MLNPVQVRMARAALNLSVKALAKLTGLGTSTIQRFETGSGEILASNLLKMQTVLEDAGVIFIHGDSATGPGVRVRKSDQTPRAD